MIRICNRPFSSLEEMNKILIEKWNSKIKPTDTVYILGDLIYKYEDIAQVKELLIQLNGYKYLIRGNHDKFLNQINKSEFFVQVCDYKKIKDNGRDVVLFHYPIEEWDGFFRDTIHLYGHIHNNASNNNYQVIKNRYNVGCDCYNFEPKTLDEIIKEGKHVS